MSASVRGIVRHFPVCFLVPCGSAPPPSLKPSPLDDPDFQTHVFPKADPTQIGMRSKRKRFGALRCACAVPRRQGGPYERLDTHHNPT